MRLAGIRPGDIVCVDDGLPYVAKVVDRDGSRVRCRRSLARAAPMSATGSSRRFDMPERLMP